MPLIIGTIIILAIAIWVLGPQLLWKTIMAIKKSIRNAVKDVVDNE